MTLIQDNLVVVDRDQMNLLLKEVEEVRKQKTTLTIKEKAILLSKGGTLRTQAVRKITGWSDRTFRRRVGNGDIPMVKDGNAYHIDTEKFLAWYEVNF